MRFSSIKALIAADQATHVLIIAIPTGDHERQVTSVNLIKPRQQSSGSLMLNCQAGERFSEGNLG